MYKPASSVYFVVFRSVALLLFISVGTPSFRRGKHVPYISGHGDERNVFDVGKDDNGTRPNMRHDSLQARV
jgi:hypothetical protein